MGARVAHTSLTKARGFCVTVGVTSQQARKSRLIEHFVEEPARVLLYYVHVYQGKSALPVRRKKHENTKIDFRGKNAKRVLEAAQKDALLLRPKRGGGKQAWSGKRCSS